MARRIWKDRVVERPRTFNMQNNPDGSVTLIPAPGAVLEEGTPVNAANLNGLEEDLETHKADNIHIPSGLISMWSGLISEIPDGWVLCDGNNGTPNLTDRFIMGATTEATINKAGGKNSVILTTEQMPSHSHTGSTNSTGGHVHGLINMDSPTSVVDKTGIDEISLESSKISTVSGAVASGGVHSHTVTVNNSGGGQPHENRPAYYTLAFIMKV